MSSRKRPSVFDTLDLTGEESASATPAPATNVVALAATEAPASPPAPEPTAPKAAAAPKQKVRGEIQHTSIYLPKAAYRKIREIALTGDRKAHDVIMEGVDLVLAKYGFPSLAEYKKGKKR